LIVLKVGLPPLNEAAFFCRPGFWVSDHPVSIRLWQAVLNEYRTRLLRLRFRGIAWLTDSRAGYWQCVVKECAPFGGESSHDALGVGFFTKVGAMFA
jgi:hypothetical protein